MIPQKTDILLDRGLLLHIAVEFRKYGSSALSTYEKAFSNYSRLLYERSGMSALELMFENMGWFQEKVVGIHTKLDLPTKEEDLLRTTISEASKRRSILHAVQKYDRERRGPSRSTDEILGYVVRLLILARQLEAGIATWQPRTHIFLSMFEEAGTSYSVEHIAKGVQLYTTSPCWFPYLPVQTILSTDNRFSLLELTDSNTTSSVQTILFISADPIDGNRLRLGEEAREIEEHLKLGSLRETFIFHQKNSVRPSDLIQAMLDIQPNIVHFSSHGQSGGLIHLEDDKGESCPVEPAALVSLFQEFIGQIQCVILNACYSEALALALSKSVPYVIGSMNELGDREAISFSTGFYQALGAGQPLDRAYNFGCAQVRLHGGSEKAVPTIFIQSNLIKD